MGFVVTTESALDPERTLASGFSHPLPRKRSALRPSGHSAPLALSTLPLDSSRRDVPRFSTCTLSRVVPVTSPDALMLKTVCWPCLQPDQLRLIMLSCYSITCHVYAWYVNTWHTITWYLSSTCSYLTPVCITWQLSVITWHPISYYLTPAPVMLSLTTCPLLRHDLSLVSCLNTCH